VTDKKLSPLRCKDVETGRTMEREKIVRWLRNLDGDGESINRFIPTTLANWIEEGMYEL